MITETLITIGRVISLVVGIVGSAIVWVVILEWLLNQFLKRWEPYTEFTHWLWDKEKFHKWLKEQKK